VSGLNEPPPTPLGTARQPFPIWCGLTLRNWLRLLSRRPPLHWSRAGRISLVTLAACVNSTLALFERIAVGGTIGTAGLSKPPLFILGHWRSGTTLLQTWLADDPQFTAPTVYQTWFPDHFRTSQRWLSRLTRRWLPSSRPMDNMPFRWDVPGEEEIALLLQTLWSPYLVAAFPEAPEWMRRYDNLQRGLSPEELQRWQDCLLRFVCKVMQGRDTRVLLKSPTHTARIPLLLRMFPDAQFVYIMRNPYDVFASTQHLHRVLYRENSLGRSPLSDPEERILSTYFELYQAYHLQRAAIPAGRRYELRFEDLVADPVGQLQQLYAHLGLDGAGQIAARLGPQLAAHRSYARNTYSLDDGLRQRIADRWSPAFRRYGYPIDLPSE
jgi:hypothetical protein